MITVAIISYRYGHLVSQAIDSVLGQTRKPDKVIVVDDGVRDCSFVKKLYPEIELVERPRNFGIVENKNDILYHLVQTDKMIMLGADNWLRPDAIEKMEKSSADIVSSWLYITGEEAGDTTGELMYLENGYVRWELPGIHGCALHDTSKARLAGGYRASGNRKSEEDSVMFGEMIKRGATFEVIKEPLLFYRRHRHNFQTW
jgi:glycosyltransferase involved in cell wall biosynthesis